MRLVCFWVLVEGERWGRVGMGWYHSIGHCALSPKKLVSKEARSEKLQSKGGPIITQGQLLNSEEKNAEGKECKPAGWN